MKVPDIASLLNRVGASASLLVIIFGTAWFWNVRYDGYNVAHTTYEITYLDPHGPASDAGLRIGDTVRSVNGVQARDQYTVWQFARQIFDSRKQSILEVARGDQVLTITIPATTSLDLQLYKIMMLLLALCMWATGYFLGIVRQHDASARRVVAIFWLVLASIISLIIPFQYGAHGLFLTVLWVLVGLVLPLFVYMHLRFPVSFATTQRSQARLRIGFWTGVGVGNLILALTLWTLNIDEQLGLMLGLLPIAFVLSGTANVVLLVLAYRRTLRGHQRRQIRIIAASMLVVVLLWVLTLVIPPLILGYAPIRGRFLAFLTILIPLAYLITGGTGDLFRLDHLARRIVIHLSIATPLIIALAQGLQWLDVPRTTEAALLAFAFAIVYDPVQRALHLLVVGTSRPPFHALETAATQLNTTLDPGDLIAILVNALREQFGNPPIVVYLQEDSNPEVLTLRTADRVSLEPVCIPRDCVHVVFPPTNGFREQRVLATLLDHFAVPPEVRSPFAHPSLVLWWSIPHPNGQPLMLIGLGMRYDLDPYGAADLTALQKLGSTASRAFAHSTAYTQLEAAKATESLLLERARTAQHDARRFVMHRVHGTVLAAYLQKNVADLRACLEQLPAGDLKTTLVQIRSREEQAITALRDLCAELFPVGLDDPLGLEMVLAIEVERVRPSWNGTLRFEVDGEAQAVNLRSQAEVLEVVRLAITNAIQHAAATEIVLELQHASRPDGTGVVTIRDDGKTAQPIQPKPNHFGVLMMRASARAIGGTIAFDVVPDVGTAVRLTFPMQPPVEAHLPVTTQAREDTSVQTSQAHQPLGDRHFRPVPN